MWNIYVTHYTCRIWSDETYRIIMSRPHNWALRTYNQAHVCCVPIRFLLWTHSFCAAIRFHMCADMWAHIQDVRTLIVRSRSRFECASIWHVGDRSAKHGHRTSPAVLLIRQRKSQCPSCAASYLSSTSYRSLLAYYDCIWAVIICINQQCASCSACVPFGGFDELLHAASGARVCLTDNVCSLLLFGQPNWMVECEQLLRACVALGVLLSGWSIYTPVRLCTGWRYVCEFIGHIRCGERNEHVF